MKTHSIKLSNWNCAMMTSSRDILPEVPSTWPATPQLSIEGFHFLVGPSIYSEEASQYFCTIQNFHAPVQKLWKSCNCWMHWIRGCLASCFAREMLMYFKSFLFLHIKKRQWCRVHLAPACGSVSGFRETIFESISASYGIIYHFILYCKLKLQIQDSDTLAAIWLS